MRPLTEKRSFFDGLRASGTYWLLQVIGWSGMVVLEMINYTFFLAGEFSWTYLQTFLFYAIIGIAVTHLTRMLLIYYDIFSRSSVVIWTVGVLATVLTSDLSVILLLLPSLLFGPEEAASSLTPIYIFGLIMNNGRYFLIWMVIYFLYQIMEQRNQITEEKFENQVRAKNFELELLKRQINPHFLFNALNSIKALVLIDAHKSREALVMLSELLRYTLNYEHQHLVTLEDEMREVRKYFALEEMRYGKRFEVHYEVSDMVLSEFIPSVLVLTLAENAIKHGVARNIRHSEIRVRADGHESGFFVAMSNTGSIRREKTGGIGLRHIERRLEEHFGASATFELLQDEENVIAIIEINQNENKDALDRRRAAGLRRIAGASERIPEH